MFHYHYNIYTSFSCFFPVLYRDWSKPTMENQLVPVPGSRCIVSQIFGIPWVAKTLYVLMDSFWLEARRLQHGSWSAEDQEGTRELELSYPWTSGKGRTAVLDHVWLCCCSPPGSSVHEISPGKNTGAGCCFLLQAIFPTQGSNLRSLYWQVNSLPLVPPGKPLGRWDRLVTDLIVNGPGFQGFPGGTSGKESDC